MNSSSKDAFADRKTGLEEDYFRKKEQELVEKIRRQAEAEAQQQGLSETLGVTNQEILDDLHALGYSNETVALLHLVPLVQVAWASGSVTASERELIIELSARRAIDKDSPAWELLNDWLDKQPSDEFFLSTLRVIRHISDVGQAPEQATDPADLIELCNRVAKASGGFLGFGNKISEGEEAALNLIVNELMERNPEAVRRMVEG